MMSATWRAKAWPARHAARLLVELLRRARVDPLMVPGPGDERRWQPSRTAASCRIRCPADQPAGTGGSALPGCDIFVGTDCGARHLAAGLGVPTVTLFGPTDPGGMEPGGPPACFSPDGWTVLPAT